MIDAADFKQYIFPLLFFKRVSDIWDEEYQEALELSDGDVDYAHFRENYRFQIPEGCHWSDVRATSSDVGKKLQNALHQIEKANFELLHDVFGDAQWTSYSCPYWTTILADTGPPYRSKPVHYFYLWDYLCVRDKHKRFCY